MVPHVFTARHRFPRRDCSSSPKRPQNAIDRPLAAFEAADKQRYHSDIIHGRNTRLVNGPFNHLFPQSLQLSLKDRTVVHLGDPLLSYFSSFGVYYSPRRLNALFDSAAIPRRVKFLRLHLAVPLDVPFLLHAHSALSELLAFTALEFFITSPAGNRAGSLETLAEAVCCV